MRKPKVDYPPIRIFRFSGPSRKEGIEEKKIEGVSVRVYNPAKTVADCFKYRNKVGGVANSRMKDFYDLWALANDFPFSGQIIVAAIQNTFKRRKTALPIGTPAAFQT